ncbi:MAG: hypothetical protein KDD60_09820, partial [Bdellovibrionales bacterium]|nr:hypothetical protein [Bdellovibrionales bacterium]
MKQLAIGIEEEYLILSKDTQALENRFSELLSVHNDPKCKLKSETHQCCVEVATTPCRTLQVLKSAVRYQRESVSKSLEKLNCIPAAIGSHPFTSWMDCALTEESRRMESLELFQDIHRRAVTYALHIHVEVPSKDAAMYIANHAREWIPFFYAVSTSSPFRESRPTGLKSSRLFSAFSYPRTGIP